MIHSEDEKILKRISKNNLKELVKYLEVRLERYHKMISKLPVEDFPTHQGYIKEIKRQLSDLNYLIKN